MKLATALVILSLTCYLAAPARPLTPEKFSVDASSYRAFGFEVSKFGRVFGGFSTQSNGRENIRVLVVDLDEFEKFRNGRPFQSYYDSGEVSAGQIDLQLRYGRYLLIFDNRSSPYMIKSIASNIGVDQS